MTKKDFVLKYFGELPERTKRDVISELEPETVLYRQDTGMLNLKENLDAIDQMERYFKLFWHSYEKIDSALRQYTEGPHYLDMVGLYWQLLGRKPVLKNSFWHDEILDLQDTDGFVARLKHNAISEFNPVHHHAIRNEHPEKYSLYEHAAYCWLCFQKKNPPRKPSPGTLFYEYLSDFIQLMGKDWSVESVVRASQKQLNDINK